MRTAGARRCGLNLDEHEEAFSMDMNVPRSPALRDVLVTNYERLRTRLSSRLGCADLASDSLHEAWLRLGDLACASPAGATLRCPESYVFRVACNAAIDSLRARRSWQHDALEDAGLEQFADDAPGPDVVVQARAELQAVERAMQRLPRKHRSVLVALRLEDSTRQEVAGRHGLSLRRVDTALRQALAYCAVEVQSSSGSGAIR